MLRNARCLTHRHPRSISGGSRLTSVRQPQTAPYILGVKGCECACFMSTQQYHTCNAMRRSRSAHAECVSPDTTLEQNASMTTKHRTTAVGTCETHSPLTFLEFLRPSTKLQRPAEVAPQASSRNLSKIREIEATRLPKTDITTAVLLSRVCGFCSDSCGQESSYRDTQPRRPGDRLVHLPREVI